LEAHGIIIPAKTKANGRKTYICPVCKNGSTGKTGDGLVVYENSTGFNYKCYFCGKYFDNIALLEIVYGLNFVDAMNRAAYEFGLSHLLKSTPPKFKTNKNVQTYEKTIAQVKEMTAEEKAQEEKLIKLIQDDIKSARKNLEKFIASNGNIRNLTFETLDYFNCGVIFNWTHPKSRLVGKKVPSSCRLIIPAGIHYNAVVFDEDRAKIEKPYWKMHAGKMIEPFGLKTITADTEIVVIYEGEIDAMSAFQSYNERKFLMDSMAIFDATQAVNLDTGKTLTNKPLANTAFLATFGAANTNWIDAFDAKCKELNIKPRVIVMLDGDDAGRQNASKHRDKLLQRGYSVAINFLEDKTNGK